MLRHEMLTTEFHRGLLTGTILIIVSGLTHAADLPIKAAFDGFDRNGNGALSLEEYLALPGMADRKIAQRNFKVVDFDHDGALTYEEFCVLPGMLPIDQRGSVPDPVADLEAEALKTWRALLKTADRNQDAKLSAAEWPQAAAKAKLAPFGELKFAVWDADGNGTVDEHEAQRLIAVGYGTEYPDGTRVRSSNGRVLFVSWIRVADKNADHVVSRAEFVTSYWLTPPDRAKLFTDLDKNNDGELNCTEMLNSPGLNIDALGMFLAYDKDLDGLLSATEVFGNASSGATKQQVAHSLEACDDDHDGKLSLGEYMLAPAGMGYVTLKLFDCKDSDKDGYLGWPEFYTEETPVLIGLAWELFRRFDRNHDGRLGLDEFEFSVDSLNVPLDVVFRIKDSNRDGRLTLTEVFTQPEPATGDAHDLERYRIRLARATDKFRQDDADGNGSLDLAEFTRARQKAAADLPETPGEYSTRLFIADSDGSNMKQLTDLPDFQKQGSPVWSPDGKFIAFDGWRPQNGQTVGSSQVVIVQADGRNPRVLGDGAMPSFSPSGHRLAFSNSRGGGVWIVSSQGPDYELVEIDPKGWGTDWSPDGRLVYSVNTPGGANLVWRQL